MREREIRSGALYDYRSVSSKRPWALGIHRPKNGDGRLHIYTQTIGSSKMVGGCLHGDGRLTRDTMVT